ncbi:class I SAM-dependent methyltransferase [Pseudomonas oryzihabitans]|uniref:Methyltransferase domain-containing protein n=1 Tax=Pseudomonas oryzihabitans TaxID=47885 RepID=A0A178L620_9PSED|nr:methionine biosynthesis protein MetW [Pseudomonas oryzihabitans]OAN24881.1 hypothetical protein A4V15_07445 [Pseudomonas oryzihabitans]
MSTSGPDLDLSRLDDHLANLIADIRQRTQALQPAAAPAEPTWEALQELDDEALVRAAYHYLTGHPIEPERLSYYLTRLRGGEDRFDLLAAIYLSPEGQRHAAPAPGLRRALLKRKLRRVPVIGRLLGLMLEVAGLPARQQRDNARYYRWQNQLALQAILLQQQSNLLEWHQQRWQILQDQAPEPRLGELERELATVEAQLAQARRQLDRSEQELRTRLSLLETAPALPLAPQSAALGVPLALERTLREHFALDDQALHGLLGFYLPLIEECPALRQGLPLVELGCGNGLWLAGLPQAIKRRGIEADADLVAQACGNGLEVEQGDALRWLSEQPMGSLGALCAFELVDRLDLAQLSSLLDEALRALAPGGLLLLQALDPAHASSACAFWLDPARQRPSPAPLLEFLCRHKGFAQVAIQRPAQAELLQDFQPSSPLTWQHYAVSAIRAETP